MEENEKRGNGKTKYEGGGGIIKNYSGYLREIMETATLKLLDDGISILALKN